MPLETLTLPESLTSYIEEWAGKPGNLIMILHRTQELYGYIPRNVAIRLSELLDVPLAKIYGVVTFYHFFKLTAPGRNNIQVCLGTACYLKGGEDLIQELENLLGIGVNAVTEDGEFSIEAVRCIGCCGLAPVLAVNGEVYGKLTKSRLPEILRDAKASRSDAKASRSDAKASRSDAKASRSDAKASRSDGGRSKERPIGVEESEDDTKRVH